ncbi:MAG: hypothetical protein EZS26_002263 [Candidatus Ordinivivax streblomastigis]|jgi:hypothetical protein|uniref:Uncharacterized protein n=1 Tax=Candidatus Ordinivivax streblomastigis TaxID=2540710 RepID=A0A5M8NZD9_9BACT|nr:MAG: hypothetical protein EZS26_002263 [Candidatus Ordinivivax streblomastigis]
MKVIIKTKAFMKIYNFYLNVAKKYKHAWSMEESIRHVEKVTQEAYKVGTQLSKREPYFRPNWRNYSVDYSKATGWYFAYRIENDTIYVEDAENYRNMSNLINPN